MCANGNFFSLPFKQCFSPCLLKQFLILTLANMCQWLCQSRRRRRDGGQPCRRLKKKSQKQKSETSAPWHINYVKVIMWSTLQNLCQWMS
jgi:hypothetical protein